MQIGWEFLKIKLQLVQKSKNYVLTIKWIKSRTRCKKNQSNEAKIQNFAR